MTGIALVLGGLAVACAIACAAAAALLGRPAARPTQVVQLLPVQQPAPAVQGWVQRQMPEPPRGGDGWMHPTPVGTVDTGGTGDPLAPRAVHVTVPAGGARTAARPVVLTGRYPQLGASLAAWLRVEPDPVERVQIAVDLGSLGTVDAARGLLDAVRDGVLSPTVAADQLERGGFDAGVVVAAAMADPDPGVRALAASIVARRMPVVPTGPRR